MITSLKGNNMFDSRIYSFYEEMKDIKNEKFPRPRYMGFYPTNTCQFNCTFCDYKALNNIHSRILSETQWKYILKSFKDFGGEAVDLCGGGEPLMLRNVGNLIKYAHDIGLHTGIVTNGLMIDRKKHYDLYCDIIEFCKYIRVSFEAGSADGFKRIKGKDYFNKILSNVSALIKDSSYFINPVEVSWKYTIPANYNMKDIYQAINLADIHGFYSIQFKPVCNAGDLTLSDEDRKIVQECIEEYVIKNNTKTLVSYNLKKVQKKTPECWICSIQTIVDCYGDVHLCCYYSHRTKNHTIGNIFRNTFEEIWNSYLHYRITKEVDIKECNMYDCRYIRYEKIMNKAMDTKLLSFI